MAKQNDMKAARERKQKIFLAVGGVVLALLAVIQGPKLLDQLKGSPAATPAPASSSGTSEAAPAAETNSGGAAVVRVQAVRAPKSATTQLAGVVIVPEQPTKAGDGQLASFTLFVSKDPFRQQVSQQLLTPAQVANLGKQPTQGSQSGTTSGGSTSSGADSGSDGSDGGSTPSAEPVSQPTLAIVKVNGVTQSIELGKRFPRGEGSFLLKSLKPGRAGIAVAGGDFAGGGVLTLRVGRQITLVNTATGARFVVKLLYVGDESQVTRYSAK